MASAPLGPGPVVDRALLAALPDRLEQPTFELTGGVHATGLFDAGGRAADRPRGRRPPQRDGQGRRTGAARRPRAARRQASSASAAASPSSWSRRRPSPAPRSWSASAPPRPRDRARRRPRHDPLRASPAAAHQCLHGRRSECGRGLDRGRPGRSGSPRGVLGVSSRSWLAVTAMRRPGREGFGGSRHRSGRRSDLRRRSVRESHTCLHSVTKMPGTPHFPRPSVTFVRFSGLESEARKRAAVFVGAIAPTRPAARP